MNLPIANKLGAYALPLSVSLSFVAGLGLREPRQDPPGPVSATEFRLVNAEGTTCGIWTATGKGTQLSVGDAAGKERIRLITTEDGFAGLVLYDDNNKMRSTWSCSKNGETAFATYGDNQVPRIEMNTTAGNAASLVIRDPEGNRRNHVGMLGSGAAAFTLFSPKDQVIAALSTPMTGKGTTPALILYDPNNGRMRASVSVGENGEPMMSLHDENERARTSWALAGNGGGLAWKDAQGRMRGVFGTAPDGTAGVMAFDAGGNLLHRAPSNFDRVPAPSRTDTPSTRTQPETTPVRGRRRQR